MAGGNSSSLWQKSRAAMRRGIGPGSRRRDEAVLAEIRANLDNEGLGARTQAATAILLPQAAQGSEVSNRLSATIWHGWQHLETLATGFELARGFK